jgi:hypothetical protein
MERYAMGIRARKHLTNTELAIAFCREQEELFAEYLDIVHNIEPTESGYVLDRAKAECAGQRPTPQGLK